MRLIHPTWTPSTDERTVIGRLHVTLRRVMRHLDRTVPDFRRQCGADPERGWKRFSLQELLLLYVVAEGDVADHVPGAGAVIEGLTRAVLLLKDNRRGEAGHLQRVLYKAHAGSLDPADEATHLERTWGG